MRLPQYLDKPEYLYRPYQAIRRLLGRDETGIRNIDLSFGLTITCNTSEDVGRSIAHYGVYDLVVTEVIHRLLHSGGIALDVGANIGHMTGVMAKCSGPNGRVVCFEPSTEVRQILETNLSRWSKDPRLSPIEIRPVAVSRSSGRAALTVGPEFGANRGTASLEAACDRTEAETVGTVTLDEEWAGRPAIDLLKVDVEGHEMAVFQGSRDLLSRKQIRNIVFEEHRPWPSPVHDLLLDHGYALFLLSRSVSKLSLEDPAKGYAYLPGVLPNYIATTDLAGLKNAVAASGWQALRG